jgi:hypothetical protein
MKTCDLHCHSTFSDGSLTPGELISLAEKQGLSALALTDHNTSKGLPHFIEAGKNSPVEAIAGCEFSTDYNDTELHIVGLGFPEKAWVEIEDYVELMHMAKKASNVSLIKKLCEAGYNLTYDEVAQTTDADEFNRAHVARVLLSKGYVSSVNEAFDKILKTKHGFYTPPKRIPSLGTIEFIKANGGVAILAHPFLNMNYEQLEEFLPKAKEAGLDAMETLYSKFSEEEIKQAKELAARFGLKESGGSDFHGKPKPDISLGTGLGNLCVPFEFAKNLNLLTTDH